VVRLAGSGTGALLATLLSVGYSSVQLENMLDLDIRTMTEGILDTTGTHGRG